MDFSKMTTDDLLRVLPPAEDDRWEFKSAAILNNNGQLKAVLSKQVSAFANSGGGFLVIGISDDRKVEPCLQSAGTQPMKDKLTSMTEPSVEYPIRHFRVHRIPVTNDADNSIFVIVIEDSPAAPHQSKEDKTYYYRLDGQSKPAPHFHLELLRNRLTKPQLDILGVEFNTKTPSRLRAFA